MERMVIWYRVGIFREVERIYHWLKDNKFRGVITGMPGSLKTTRITILPMFTNTPVVLSVPLRMLRNELYYKIKNDANFSIVKGITTIFYSHDEVCQALKNRIQTNPNVNYLKHLSDHVSAVEKGQEQCLWRYELDRMIDILKQGGPRLIITTHKLGFVLKLIAWNLKIKHNIIFVFDEGEDLLVKLGEPIDLGLLIDLKVHKKIYRKIRSIYKPLYEGMRSGYLLLPLVRDLFRESIFVTATFPPTLKKSLDMEYDEYPMYRMRVKRVNDKIVLLDKILIWKDEEKWKKEVYPVVLGIVGRVHSKGYPVGIVSRNLEQTKTLTNLLEEMGYVVWSDGRDTNPIPFYFGDVVIITVLGRGYRGVNFYTKKSDKRWDFPVVIGFFQGRGMSRKDIHPFFYGLLSDNPFKSEEDELGNFIKEMTMGKNFQSLFRFIRDKEKEHLLILMDKRWEEALKMYSPKYYLSSKPLKVEDIGDITTKVFPLIDTMF